MDGWMDEIEILEYWKYSYFKVVLKHSARAR